MAGIHLRNGIRRMRQTRLDYVVFPVGGPLPERNGPPRGFIERRLPLPADPLSLQEVNYRFRAVADDDSIRGVVLIFRGFSAGLATLQNFRAAIARFRATGKEVIVYTPYVDLRHYYAATAADLVVIPPGSHFEVLGLYAELTFLKDALSKVGIKAEVVQISPYKTAMDQYSRGDISPEHREQLNWLLDDQFNMLTVDIAADRHMDPLALRRMIDRGPITAAAAFEAGLVDGVAYDDELPAWLGNRRVIQEQEIAASADAAKDLVAMEAGSTAASRTPEAKLKPWQEARGLLVERPRRRTRRYVGVISVEGLIAMGASRRPPVDLPIPLIGGLTAGEQTVVSMLRRVEKLDGMAALILHIDSGGGSALASDLIGREVERLAARKPVLVYMGNLAASGGYFVAATAGHIMSQRATLTGSIGVIQAKIAADELYERLSINRVTVERGRHAGLYRSSSSMTAEQKEIFQRTINEIYEQFKGVVSRGRNLPVERIDEIGSGRVWTGRQAQERGLVDSHGDFLDAIKKAAKMAGLPAEDVYAIPVSNFFPRSSGYVLPIAHSSQVLDEITRLLTGEEARALVEQPLLLLPYDLRFR